MALPSTTNAPVPLGEYVPDSDRRVVLHGVGWQGFKALLAMRGDRPVPRMTYLEGAVELMAPSRHHEFYKKIIAAMLEWYLLERKITYCGYGGWLVDDESEEAGKEPDECYIFGNAAEKERPDLAIEIIWTSGGLNSLEVYRRLGVREVWFWKQDKISVHVLVGDSYESRERSGWLPDLDLTLICRLAHSSSFNEAIEGLKAALAVTL